jgi:hypothetical protein
VDRKGNFSGFTTRLRVPDVAAGLTFHEDLTGRAPDSSPHVDFCEGELQSAAWFQLGQGKVTEAYPLRFAVRDIAAEVSRMPARFEITCSEILRVPEVVAWCNFEDPWDNRLGILSRSKYSVTGDMKV